VVVLHGASLSPSGGLAPAVGPHPAGVPAAGRLIDPPDDVEVAAVALLDGAYALPVRAQLRRGLRVAIADQRRAALVHRPPAAGPMAVIDDPRRHPAILADPRLDPALDFVTLAVFSLNRR
jgi:hypothetical protein